MQNKNYFKSIFAAIILGLSFPGINCFGQSQLPHFKKQGSAIQLIVDDKPYFVLGGELHNSTSSGIEYMDPILAKLSEQHLNTVLASVCWDLIEPKEGVYDFHLVDGLINSARKYNLRVVILWFASWKNGVSTYTPAWVKTNQERFPRAKNKDGKSLDILSTFSTESREADAKAFAALMRHIREVDGDTHTVLMMQVQNEVGVLGDSRDRCDAANEAFQKQVPRELLDYMKKHKDELVPEFRKRWEDKGAKTTGNWEEIFGSGVATDEIFMAWNYALYVDKVTAAGKAEYPIPMFVNAWLAEWKPSGTLLPGAYPSGGPIPFVMDVWNAGAPNIDMQCPDNYSFFEERCDLYHRYNNPLFIPEMSRNSEVIGSIFYALQHDAMGFSPFGMESAPEFSEELSQCYDFLSSLVPLMLEKQGNDAIRGTKLSKESPKKTVTLGDYTLHLATSSHWSFKTPEYPSVVVIQTGTGEYVIGGKGVNITFSPNTPGKPNVGVLSCEDGKFVDGRWVVRRFFNGDEILSGQGVRLRGDNYYIARIKLYRY